MTSVPYPLVQFTSVTLDGSGNGRAAIGPQRVKEHWQVASASVSVATNNAEASCSVYLGSTADATTFLSNTATGSSGDTCSISGIDMQPGMLVTAIWSGGDPGARATVVVKGTYTLGSP